MGFYFRKSISVGGLRFNFSKSGIGVSTGFRGFRIGTGPKGNYVSMGLDGIYYRKTFSPGGAPNAIHTRQTQPAFRPTNSPSPMTGQGALGATTTIDSADAMAMVDSNSSELLAEINEKRKRFSWFPLVLFLSLVALVGSALGAPIWLWILEIAAFPILGFYARRYDLLRKTVVLFYNLDTVAEQAYQELHDDVAHLAACGGTWNIEQTTAVGNRKYHAGAGTLLKRARIQIGRNSPSVVKSNVELVSLPAGRQTLYFFPDRILVVDATGVGAVGYSDLSIQISPSTFIEEDGVPHDAQVIDWTWRYVNKNGGPDRRFSNNRELPVCRYEELRIMSHGGLNELFQFSRTGVCAGFERAIHKMVSVCKRVSPMHPAPFKPRMPRRQS
jgi:hypothetical protein